MLANRTVVLALIGLVGACGDIVEGAEGPQGDPIIEAVSPGSGGVGGGTEILIVGSGFTEDSIVIVGERQATDVELISDTELHAVTPSGAAPATTVGVSVLSDAGTGELPNAFTYNPTPVILSASPRGGSSAGGTEVTLTGRGFLEFSPGSTTVTFGGEASTIVAIESDTRIVVETPVAQVEPFTPLEISLSNANGQSTLADGYFYTKPGLLAASSRGLIGQGGALYYIDPANPVPLKLADLPFGVTNMSMAPDDTLYIMTRRNGPGPFFGTLDPLAGTLSIINPVDTNNSTSMAHIGSTLYAYSHGTGGGTNPTSQLRTLNTDDGTTTPVAGAPPLKDAPYSLSGSTRLARRDDNSLYACNVMSNGGTLWSINVGTGVATSLTTLTTGGTGFCHGMAVVSGQVLAVQWNQVDISNLVTIDPDDGTVTQVFSAPFRITGLTQTPSYF